MVSVDPNFRDDDLFCLPDGEIAGKTSSIKLNVEYYFRKIFNV